MQKIQRARHFHQVVCRNVRVDRGGAHGGMSEQLLNHPHGGVCFEQADRVDIAQAV